MNANEINAAVAKYVMGWESKEVIAEPVGGKMMTCPSCGEEFEK